MKNHSLNILKITKKELLQFSLLSITGYLFSYIVMFLVHPRPITIALVISLLFMYTLRPNTVLFLVYNIVLFSGLIGSSFRNQAVFLVDRLTLPASWGGNT